MTPEERARLRSLAESATPGPWRTEYLLGQGNDLLTAVLGLSRSRPPRVVGSLLRESDGHYVVAASPDVVLALLSALDAAEAERDRLAAAVERVRAMPVGPPSGGYFMLSMRDVLRALDGGGE